MTLAEEETLAEATLEGTSRFAIQRGEKLAASHRNSEAVPNGKAPDSNLIFKGARALVKPV